MPNAREQARVSEEQGLARLEPGAIRQLDCC